MQKTIEQRNAIKFCFKAGMNGVETYRMMKTAYGDDCLSRSNIFEWFSKFRDGRQSVEDDERTGRPCTSRTDTNVEAVHAALLKACRITV